MTMECPACRSVTPAGGGEASARTVDAGAIGSSRRESPPITLATCPSCGLGWQVHPPGAEALDAAYASLRDETYVAEGDNRRRTFERGQRLVRRYAPPPSVDLLDVGCSAGLFLEVAMAAGWNAWGIEPSTWLSERAKAQVGDRVVTAKFDDAAVAGRQFDVVTMWDVLEHVPDPGGFLGTARRALRPGGVLALNVPARDTWVASLLGGKWPLILPEHLFYFSRPSLTQWLTRAGFDVLGFHAHVVEFSLAYILHRLGQPGWPLAGAVQGPAVQTPVRIPLLMGEVTVVARSRRE